MKQLKEIFMKVVFLISACASILAILLICFFLFSNGIPAMSEIGFGNFLLGDEWRPLNGEFGIFPMIIGSLYVTAGAIIVGVPIGLLCAMFMARFCPKRLYSVLKPAIDLMAGIPSIVYGFFGILVIVPAVHNLFGTSGKGLLTASLLLGMMILPTIIGVCETQIRSVPEQYYEGSLALGATHERSVFFVLLPAAKSGVLAGIILGIGRRQRRTQRAQRLGRQQTAGNQPIIPESITSGVRTMTANIVLEMGYAEGLHKEALIATGVVLFVFILIINLSFSALKGKK